MTDLDHAELQYLCYTTLLWGGCQASGRSGVGTEWGARGSISNGLRAVKNWQRPRTNLVDVLDRPRELLINSSLMSENFISRAERKGSLKLLRQLRLSTNLPNNMIPTRHSVGTRTISLLPWLQYFGRSLTDDSLKQYVCALSQLYAVNILMLTFIMLSLLVHASFVYYTGNLHF